MKKIILSAVMLASTLTFAQNGQLTVSGTVDVYGTTNFNQGGGAPGLLVASPENSQAFGLGAANTVFSYEGSKSGVVADLSFGPKADDANLAGAINQLYAYYNVNDKLTLTAGQFNTFLGYEVISPAANFNYTVSYLFNAGPFSHTGVKADFAASEDLSFMLALTNDHAYTSADGLLASGDGNDLQLGGQIGYKGQYLNLIYGHAGFAPYGDAFFIDYTGGFDLSEKVYLGINAAYATSDEADAGYQGIALYLQGALTDTFSLGLRPELFQTTGSSEGDVFAITLTGSKELADNFKLIGDLRLDSSEDGLIEAGNGEDSMFTATVAAVYSF